VRRLPLPERGSVIRYSYLWANERQSGREDGSKDRPALVLALSIVDEDGQLHVLVLPITHSPPADAAAAVELPSDVKRSLRLDDERSWIVTTEANAFVWPGPDLRPVAGRKQATPFYGRIPPTLLRRIAQSYLDNRRRRMTTTVSRTV